MHCSKLLSLIIFSSLAGRFWTAELDETMREDSGEDEPSLEFQTQTFRCIMKVMFQRLFEKDVELQYTNEEKHNALTEEDREAYTKSDITRIQNLDSYIIKMRGFLLQKPGYADLNPIKSLQNINFIRLFNQVFIDFTNFKLDYQRQIKKCGLQDILVNTEKRCRSKYGEHCELNDDKISFGVKCPEKYTKYKNYFCFIDCPDKFIERNNHCVKPPHTKVLVFKGF